MSANLSTRVLLLAILELIVGGVVVLGGAALISFSVDAYCWQRRVWCGP